jgi:isopenicillin-N epimerase
MTNIDSYREYFLLNPSITFLNFGSFGATPKPIMEELHKWQAEMEYEPVQFIAVRSLGYLKKSREALASFIHCNADDLVYTPNPSYAINIIAKSLKLNQGDEILSTDLEYGAMDRTWNYYCKKQGAKYVRQPISLPVLSKEKFIEDFWKGYSKNTKAIFISHITSTTALKLPVKEICEEAKKRGLLTIVDGAHVPGHIPLDLRELHADIYTGACHKWMMTPKGSSFLYVKKEFQNQFDPLVVSWGYESVAPSPSKFLDYHEMQGTRDFTAFLTIPRSIQFMQENNWLEVAKNCATLAQSNYKRFCDLMNTLPLCPINNDFLGQMCSIPIKTNQPEKLKSLLYDQYKIEIPVMVHGKHTFLRYSIQAFNDQSDLDKLYAALQEIKNTTELLLS